jgi:hypothetical protein
MPETMTERNHGDLYDTLKYSLSVRVHFEACRIKTVFLENKSKEISYSTI